MSDQPGTILGRIVVTAEVTVTRDGEVVPADEEETQE